MSKILLIEDDAQLAQTTCQYLEKFGFEVEHQDDGFLGVEAALAGDFDLVLLDLMLPGIDGLEICRRLRAEASTAQLPIVMLTARGDETDRIVGLELGADDYIPKPFSLRELVARIRANLRRVSLHNESAAAPVHTEKTEIESGGGMGDMGAEFEGKGEKLQVGTIEIDRGLRSARVAGELIELTATEFELLWVFASRPHQVMTREQLLDQVRGREFDAFDRSIDVHISKLRKKIESNPRQPRVIQTVWGVGYRFVPATGS